MRPSTSALRSYGVLSTSGSSAQCLRSKSAALPSVTSPSILQSRSLSSRVPHSASSSLPLSSKRATVTPIHNSPSNATKIAFYHASDVPSREWHPPTDGPGVQAYLSNIFPGLEFPEKLATRMVTHASWKGGIEGHNSRLAFIGRRVLHAYLVLFLHSAAAKEQLPTSSPEAAPTPFDYEKVVEKALDTFALGVHVGRSWQAGQVMRWVSAAPSRDGSGKQGLGTVGGTMVEAVMGGVLHQFGGNVAHRVFHTRVLPHLKPALPSSLHQHVDEVCEEMGGLNAQVSDTRSGRGSSAKEDLLDGLRLESSSEKPRRVAAGYA